MYTWSMTSVLRGLISLREIHGIVILKIFNYCFPLCFVEIHLLPLFNIILDDFITFSDRSTRMCSLEWIYRKTIWFAFFPSSLGLPFFSVVGKRNSKGGHLFLWLHASDERLPDMRQPSPTWFYEGTNCSWGILNCPFLVRSLS